MAESKTPRLGLSLYSSGTDLHPNRDKFNAEHQLMEVLLATARKGTTAERPEPGDGLGFYWATDAKQLYFDDGVAWQQVNTTGGGGAGQPIVIGGNPTEGTSARAARADHTHALPLATSTTPGAMPSTDKALLDGAGAVAAANRILKASANGDISVNTPTSPLHPARKDYVDNTIQTAVLPLRPIQPKLLGSNVNLDDLKTTQDYLQRSSTAAASGSNYPVNLAGYLDVVADDGSQFVWQFYTVHGSGTRPIREFVRAYYASDGTWSVWKEQFRGLATAATAGAMSADDKNLLDNATWQNVGNMLARRTPAGNLHTQTFVIEGAQSANVQAATRKDYVDNLIAGRAPVTHTHSADDTTSGVFAPARLPLVTSTAPGALPSSHYMLLVNATALPTADTLVKRDPAGRTLFNSAGISSQPVNSNDATRKDYVDSKTWDAADIASGVFVPARLPVKNAGILSTQLTVTAGSYGDYTHKFEASIPNDFSTTNVRAVASLSSGESYNYSAPVTRVSSSAISVVFYGKASTAQNVSVMYGRFV